MWRIWTLWACTSFLSVIPQVLTLYLLLFVGGWGEAAQQGDRKHLMQPATQSSSPA